MPPTCSRPILVCPLAAERSALRRSPGWPSDWAIDVSGPGDAGVRRWFERRQPTGPVLFIGTAGGLKVDAAVGIAGLVSEIVDPTGRRLAVAATRVAHGSIPQWRVVTVAAPASTPEAKRRLRDASSAAIVDMESAAIADEATRRGIAWSIIRGISDGPDDSLPDGIERLVDRDGGTRIGAAIACIARRPMLLGPLRRLGARTAAAMTSAAAIAQQLFAEEAPR